MNKLTKEQLDHVANLARLSLTDKESIKFQTDLALILNDIKKIEEVELDDDINMMISPSKNKNMYRDGSVVESIRKDQALRSSKLSNGEYIVVPGVIND